jgi:hypothetical protein
MSVTLETMIQKIPNQNLTAEIKRPAVERAKDGESVSAVLEETGLVEQVYA